MHFFLLWNAKEDSLKNVVTSGFGSHLLTMEVDGTLVTSIIQNIFFLVWNNMMVIK